MGALSNWLKAISFQVSSKGIRCGLKGKASLDNFLPTNLGLFKAEERG
jgi:hypothetical protein